MKEQKDIEGLKKAFLDIFSSTVQVNSRPIVQSNSLNIDPPPQGSGLSDSGGVNQDKEININLTIDGGPKNLDRDYSKNVSFNSNKSTYNINLKKNETPVEKILLQNSNILNSLNPLSLSRIDNNNINNENLFVQNKNITNVNLQRTLKNKRKNVAFMSFITKNPYNFATNIGKYYITAKNDNRKINNLKTNETKNLNFSEKNNNLRTINNIETIIDNSNNIQTTNHSDNYTINKGNQVNNQSDNYTINKGNQVNNQSDNYTINKGNQVNNQSNSSLTINKGNQVNNQSDNYTINKGNQVNNQSDNYTINKGNDVSNQSVWISNNTTKNTNTKTENITKTDQRDDSEGKIIKAIRQKDGSIIFERENTEQKRTTLVNLTEYEINGKTAKVILDRNLNETTILKNESLQLNNKILTENKNTKNIDQINQDIVNHNTKQLNNPNYTFLTKESYLTVDPTKGETARDVERMSFKTLQERLVNRIEARTILSNKENKILIPAFSGGGIVNSSKILKIGGGGTALVGESGSEMIIPTKLPNETKTVSMSPKDVLLGNETSEIKSSTSDNISKTIEKNMDLKKQSSTSEALEEEKNKDEEKIKERNQINNTTKDTTNQLNKPAPQNNIKVNPGPSSVERFKSLIRNNPIWRTQHM